MSGTPRNQSLILCGVTFLVGVALIALHLRWDIPQLAQGAAAPAAPGTPTGPPAPAPAPAPQPSGGGPVVPVPAPTPATATDKDALLQGLQRAYVQLEALEADILTAPTGQLTPAGHFYMTKPTGEESFKEMKLRVTFTAVPATELALAAGTVKVYQPTRRFAVTRNVEEAAQDWLADYLELTQNIDLTFLQSDELKARKQAALVITPRQPKNIRRAVVTVDLATHLPVHFEVELPLKKQIVAFGRVKTGGPIDPAVFDVTLPAGMTWTAR